MEKIFEYKVLVDSAEIDIAIQKSEDLKESMQDTSDAGTKSFSKVGDEVKNMGKEFQKSGKDITELGTKGKGAFGSLSSGFKSMTGSAQSFSAALKANPVFILFGIITPLVTLFKKISDAMGLTTIVTDALSKAFDYLISSLKKLTDWLGISDYAGEERAENAQKALEKEIKQVDELNNAYSGLQDAQIKFLRSIGKEDEANKLYLKNLAEQYKLTYDNNLKAKEEFEKEIDRINKEIANTRSLETQKALSEERDNILHSLDLLNSEMKTNLFDYLSDVNKKVGEMTKGDETENAKRLANYKAYLSARMNAANTIKDLELQLMEEGVDKELAINQNHFDKLIEQTKSSTTLNAEEKARIIKLYEERAVEEAIEIRNKANDAEVKSQETLARLLLEIKKNELEEREALIANYSDEEDPEKQQAILDQLKVIADAKVLNAENLFNIDKKLLEDKLLNEEISQEEFDARMILLAQKKAKTIKGIQDDLAKSTTKDKKEGEVLARKTGEAEVAIAANVSGAISGMLEDGSDEAKGFAVAQALFQTYLGIQAAFTSTSSVPGAAITGANIAAAAQAAIFGFANVAKILKTDSKKGGSGDKSTPSVGSVSSPSTPTPDFNFFGTGNQTGGDSSQFNIEEENSNPPIRAVVSWSELDSVGNADSNLRKEMQL